MRTKNGLRRGVAAAAMIATTAMPALATPLFSTTPTLIQVPANVFNKQPNGALTSYDISTYDAPSGLFYLADRSNAAIDVFNLNNNTFVGQLGAGQFVGQKSSNALSGADGTAVFTTTGPNPVKLVLGGDGNSSVKAYAITGNPATLAGYTPSYVVNTALPGIPVTSTGPGGSGPGSNRADEMSYNPVGNNVLVANNAASPVPYTTLFNASTGAIISQTIFDGTKGTPDATGNSIEASIYDPAHNVYWLAIPQIGPSASDPGGLSEINADTGAPIATFSFAGAANANGCNPTGVALSNNGQVAIGCSNPNSQTLIFDTTTHIFTSVPYSGSDAVVFDAQINAFLVSGNNYFLNGVLDPSFAIIDASNDLISQIIASSPGNDHSIDGGLVIGVPFSGSTPTKADPICPTGCLAVFSQVAVPEPGALPLFATAIVGLIGLAVRRRLS